MNLRFVLTVVDDETSETIVRVEALSQESLDEQWRKVDTAIESYQEKHLDFAKDNGEQENPID